ncbi:MAG: hypothetical protein IJ301_01920 [Clostridia bacterium]|nr:hypothetical protein [Clostridia bacterium]
MSITKKWVGIIIGIVLLLSAGTGTGIYFLTSNNSPNALTSYTSLGDIVRSDNKNYVNSTTYTALMGRLGSKTGTVGTLDSGTPIVITMAGHDWQVVYRDPNNTDIITVWMCEIYTTAVFNASTSNGNNYNGSTIQTTVKNYFSTCAGNYPVLNSITVSPSSMSSSYKTAQDKQYTRSIYTSVNGAISTLSDKFWLPSYYETFSFWGLDATDRAMVSPNACWLRSGSSSGSAAALRVTYSGSDNGGAVNSSSNGVRPAAHISLSALANSIGYNVSASVGSNCSVNTTSQFYGVSSATPITFTYTAKTNYYINTLKIGSTTATITDSTTAPSSYTTLTNTQYKAYRPTVNTVSVILYDVSADISISATTATNITISNLSSSLITGTGVTRSTYNTTTATITTTYASGYYPQFKYNSNEYIKIAAAGGSGGIGAVAYDYTFSSNVLTLNFSGLPTGVANIPTITLNTHTLGDNKITVNVSNAAYSITYESTEAIVNVTPNSGYYITQAYVDSNSSVAQALEYYRGRLKNVGNCFGIDYMVQDSNYSVKFIIYDLSGALTLNLLTTTQPNTMKESAGAGIDALAVYATNGGEVRLTGTDLADDNDTVVCMAVPYAGYVFAGWTDSDGNNLGSALSVRLTKEQVQGKVITANFAKASNNVNTETNNTNELT